jgi:hypothetical protein
VDNLSWSLIEWIGFRCKNSGARIEFFDLSIIENSLSIANPQFPNVTEVECLKVVEITNNNKTLNKQCLAWNEMKIRALFFDVIKIKYRTFRAEDLQPRRWELNLPIAGMSRTLKQAVKCIMWV